MIQLDIFGEKLDKAEMEATKYANNNVQTILRVLIDLLEDNNDFEPSDFLPRNNFHISEETWKDRVYELYDIIKSPVIRTYLKPKYEFLLYCIIEWWEDCSDDEEILPNRIDPVLKAELMKRYENEEDGTAEYVIKALTTYEDYYYIFFQDHDFLPENVEKLIMMYLESPKLFAELFADIELNDIIEN